VNNKLAVAKTLTHSTLYGDFTHNNMNRLKSKIRDIPDFPKAGIIFKDITPLVKEPAALKLAVHQLIQPFLGSHINVVAGMEARGFIFGSLVAWEMGLPFVPLRKPGKLPYDVQSVSYNLEYGSATLEAHIDAFEQDDKVLLIDDLLATGGTAKASCELVEKLGATVEALAFVVELDFLKGREQLANYRVHSLLHF
jgi:adenine phosphoribosyltransferase